MLFFVSSCRQICSTAICDQFTKVSLDATGNARLFATTLDDGSLNNCAVVEYKIAKMVDSCAATAPTFLKIMLILLHRKW